MDHRASRKIQNAHLFQPSALAPDPMAQGIVDQRRPQEAEKQERLEFNALHKGAGNQSRRDDREHHLKSGKKPVGNRLAVVSVGQCADPRKPEIVQTPDETLDIGAEGQRVTVQHPLNADQGHEDITQGQRGKNILPADHAAIEKGQGRCH